MDDDILEYNFWPSFADLMLSLVLVMVVSMFAFIFYLSLNSINDDLNLKQVRNHQVEVVREIASAFKSKYIALNKTSYGISLSGSKNYDIKVMNDAKVQQITFSTLILFNQNDYRLNRKGKEAIKIFGSTLKKNLPLIKDIQIQGHADTDHTALYRSNMELAALRSIEVFQLLKNDVGIDPAKYLMSVTSFGEYKPVNRDANGSFDAQRLQQANDTYIKKNNNRRIEILLFYK